MNYQIDAGSVYQSLYVRVYKDDGSTNATPLAYNAAGLAVSYHRDNGPVVAVALAALASAGSAYLPGGWTHVANGEYRIDLPDAAFASGASRLSVIVTDAPNIKAESCVVTLIAAPSIILATDLTAAPTPADIAVATRANLDATRLNVNTQAINHNQFNAIALEALLNGMNTNSSPQFVGELLSNVAANGVFPANVTQFNSNQNTAGLLQQFADGLTDSTDPNTVGTFFSVVAAQGTLQSVLQGIQNNQDNPEQLGEFLSTAADSGFFQAILTLGALDDVTNRLNQYGAAKPGAAMTLTPAERTATAAATRVNLDGSPINVNAAKWGNVNVTGMPMPTYTQPTGFLAAAFPAIVGDATAATQTTLLNAVNAVTTNTARSAPRVPDWFARPAVGSIAYTGDLYLYNLKGQLEDADAGVTVHARTAAGVSRDASLTSTAMVRLALGVYRMTYTVASTAAAEAVYFDFTWAVGGAAMKDGAAAEVQDAENFATLAAIKGKTDQLSFYQDKVLSDVRLVLSSESAAAQLCDFFAGFTGLGDVIAGQLCGFLSGVNDNGDPVGAGRLLTYLMSDYSANNGDGAGGGFLPVDVRTISEYDPLDWFATNSPRVTLDAFSDGGHDGLDGALGDFADTSPKAWAKTGDAMGIKPGGLTAASIAAGALNGKGDWPSAAQIAAALLTNPANKLTTDTAGRVGVNNFPVEFLSSAEQTSLTTAVNDLVALLGRTDTAPTVTAIQQGVANVLLRLPQTVQFDGAGNVKAAGQTPATLDAGSIDGVRAILERAGGPLAAVAAASGSGLTPGASPLTWHITLDITGVLADADCWITRTSDPSTQVVDIGRTNTSGDVRFFADKFQVDGTTLVTYYGHAQKDNVMSLRAVPLTCD